MVPTGNPSPLAGPLTVGQTVPCPVFTGATDRSYTSFAIVPHATSRMGTLKGKSAFDTIRVLGNCAPEAPSAPSKWLPEKCVRGQKQWIAFATADWDTSGTYPALAEMKRTGYQKCVDLGAPVGYRDGPWYSWPSQAVWNSTATARTWCWGSFDSLDG